MKQPPGYNLNSNKVLKLKKALYGTKQAPHNWNNTINSTIISLGYKRLQTDTCVYMNRSKNGKLMILAIFVDDIISAYDITDEMEWNEMLNVLMKTYKIQEINDCEWLLGMRITRDRKNHLLTLDQNQYIDKVLKRFKMDESHPNSTPEITTKLQKTQENEETNNENIPYQEAVGSLIYASISTRLDITHAVHEVSRHMSNYTNEHWIAVKRILRYLKTKGNLVYKR